MSDDISPVHYGALVAVVASTRVTGAAGGEGGQGGGQEGEERRCSSLQIQGQRDAHCSLQSLCCRDAAFRRHQIKTASPIHSPPLSAQC